MSTFYIGLGTVFGMCLALLVITFAAGSNEAMAQCELTHSHDTCFQLLNR